ncbi:hypothetical protein Pcinc_037080 [Petrolisthes cinctipes]|uniref:Uncharacterized protein n=1 Tax=Petrolisthes cinctipes TaxID=88211 RepID=A0AAE1BWE4_PETCI|nr:hypothetical protein Pcinc_037080 [Petrolisthes cinctipes]
MSDTSSSSDSEDDSRFKEACDPTLSVCFTRPETTKEEKTHITKTPTLDKPSSLTDSKHSFDVIDDPRESFTLVNKVKQSVANLHSNKGYQRTADCHQTGSKSSVVSSRKKKTDIDSPSPYSPFLAKHLSSVLEKNVKFEATPSQNQTAQETGGDRSSIFILKNVTLKAYSEEDAEKDRKKRKKAATKAMKKYSYFDSSDEEEVSSRCRSLAVTPDWLINNNHFPWPHPKNTRYLDEYILKERRADGSIVATSKETSSEGICAGVMKTGKRYEGHQQEFSWGKTDPRIEGVSGAVTQPLAAQVMPLLHHTLPPTP